jgi:hypothetical protein
MTTDEGHAFMKDVEAGKFTEIGLPPTTKVVDPATALDVKNRWTAWEATRSVRAPKPGHTKA